jgi:hypothetical protein
MGTLIDTASNIIAFAALVIGAWWGIVKFLKRDEHFPRVMFEVSANFVGVQDNQILFEVLAVIENKGVVPLKINDFNFKVRALHSNDSLNEGGISIRHQVKMPHLLKEGSWVPEDWDYTFIYPGVKTEYNYITAVPVNVTFIRVEGSFFYERLGSSHHAAKLLKVPNKFEEPIN